MDISAAYFKWLGIPPDEQPAHHYRLLGVRALESDGDVIANAADQRMAYLRTFQTGPHADLSQQILNHVAAARVCLLNTERKKAYDAELRARLAARAKPNPPPAPAAPPSAPAPPATAPAVAAPPATEPEGPAAVLADIAERAHRRAPRGAASRQRPSGGRLPVALTLLALVAIAVPTVIVGWAAIRRFAARPEPEVAKAAGDAQASSQAGPSTIAPPTQKGPAVPSTPSVTRPASALSSSDAPGPSPSTLPRDRAAAAGVGVARHHAAAGFWVRVGKNDVFVVSESWVRDTWLQGAPYDVLEFEMKGSAWRPRGFCARSKPLGLIALAADMPADCAPLQLAALPPTGTAWTVSWNLEPAPSRPLVPITLGSRVWSASVEEAVAHIRNGQQGSAHWSSFSYLPLTGLAKTAPVGAPLLDNGGQVVGVVVASKSGNRHDGCAVDVAELARFLAPLATNPLTVRDFTEFRQIETIREPADARIDLNEQLPRIARCFGQMQGGGVGFWIRIGHEQPVFITCLSHLLYRHAADFTVAGRPWRSTQYLGVWPQENVIALAGEMPPEARFTTVANADQSRPLFVPRWNGSAVSGLERVAPGGTMSGQAFAELLARPDPKTVNLRRLPWETNGAYSAFRVEGGCPVGTPLIGEDGGCAGIVVASGFSVDDPELVLVKQDLSGFVSEAGRRRQSGEAAYLSTLRIDPPAVANRNLAGSVTPRRNPSVSGAPRQQQEYRLTLPSGKELDTARFSASQVSFENLVAKGENLAVLKYPSGQPFAAASHRNGTLDGMTVAMYDNGDPLTYVTYKQGDLHGDLMTWNQRGQRVVFAQFRRDKPHGFYCLYQDDRLWAVLEYELGQVRSVNLVDQQSIGKSFPGKSPAEQDPAGREVLARVTELTGEMADNERDFKKQVAQYVEAERRARARVLSSQRTQDSVDRIRQHDEERSAFLRGMRRRFSAGP